MVVGAELIVVVGDTVVVVVVGAGVAQYDSPSIVEQVRPEQQPK